MFPKSKVTEIYCMADDFCKEFTLQQEKYMIKDMKTMHHNKPNRMSDAEIMVILILFHSGGFRCFKHYYKEYVCKHLKHLFPRQVSYNRFVELEKEVLLPMTIFIKKVLLGTCTGISFVDSTPLCVCRNQRILIHKTFEGLAERGRCSMGWFFGFKLHLIINDKGEILNFMFTPGNVDDREPLKQGRFLENIKGKLCADKGYIGQALFENLFLNGIQLVTKVKNNMRNSLTSIADKILLRKRALIETVNDELKNIAQIEHSRHRSFSNFIANSLSAIAASGWRSRLQGAAPGTSARWPGCLRYSIRLYRRCFLGRVPPLLWHWRGLHACILFFARFRCMSSGIALLIKPAANRRKYSFSYRIIGFVDSICGRLRVPPFQCAVGNGRG